MARYSAVGFSIGAYGYVATGLDGAAGLKDCWQYDTLSDSWTVKSLFGGTARENATGFSCAGKGYLGTGDDPFNKKDFWQFDPSQNAGIDENSLQISFSVYPNPMKESATLEINSPLERGKEFVFELYNPNGKLVRKSSIINNQYAIESGSLKAGVYFYEIKNNNQVVGSGKIIVQ